MRLEPLQRGQLVVIGPRGVIRDEVQIQEVVGGSVKVLDVRVASVELTEGDALVTADVLDAVLLARFPKRLGFLLIIKPPTLLLGSIECVGLQP